MAITDYGVVVRSAKSVTDATDGLREEVLTAIKRGWQPLGGVSIEAEQLSDGTFRFVAVQAMGK